MTCTEKTSLPWHEPCLQQYRYWSSFRFFKSLETRVTHWCSLDLCSYVVDACVLFGVWHVSHESQRFLSSVDMLVDLVHTKAAVWNHIFSSYLTKWNISSHLSQQSDVSPFVSVRAGAGAGVLFSLFPLSAPRCFSSCESARCDFIIELPPWDTLKCCMFCRGFLTLDYFNTSGLQSQLQQSGGYVSHAVWKINVYRKLPWLSQWEGLIFSGVGGA